MAKSIFEALFYGKVNPWERRVEHSAERTELEQRIENEKRHFIEKMSLDDCQRFQTLESLYTQASEDEEIDIFSYGFTMGAIIMLEVLTHKDNLTRD